MVILVVIAGVYLWITKNGSYEDEQIMCTADALICPDGSAVGRTGPNCEFSACPNQTRFIGDLMQQGSNFFLDLGGAPESNPGTYFLPLNTERISIPLETHLGRSVRVTGSFSNGDTLEVETLETMERDNYGVMEVGDTEFINGVLVTLNKIVEDSRCPTDVVCIWAGRLVVNVTFKSDTDEETLNLTTGEPFHNFDIFKVSVESASPNPVSTRPISAGDYTVIFKVEK